MVRQAHQNLVRVRIAPSPTGFAHVGTAYAALFNWAFAKKNNGKFVIRLEDTDVKRHVKGAEKAIYEGLSWLGFTWNEGPNIGGKYGPYRQSERLDIYTKYSKKLLDRGLAYKDEGAIRFKNPQIDISWKDLIRGEITFPGDQITDFVIIKSDGYPTYNFAVAVDDSLMEISHVIRGEEHISNTPRQLAIYEAFDKKPPRFAHLPTLRNKDRKKLSKRRDPVDLNFFKDQGYLPEALVNFLCLLGWSHPKEKEIFDIDEFVKLLSLRRVRKAGPIFNIDKLDWINGEYIRQLKVDELSSKFKVQSSKLLKGVNNGDLKKITFLIKDRIKKLSEFESLAGFFFSKPRVDKKLFGKDHKKHLESAMAVISTLEKWELDKINKALLVEIERKKYKTGKFFMDLRIALTGKKVTPPINESIVILGKKVTLSRLKAIVQSSK